MFQGNIRGEGGAPMKVLEKGVSSKGGYREPARMGNAVHRTNTAHHPDPCDSEPCEQDISVYYDKAHQKGSGFGLVTVDTEKKSYTLDSFRFLVDATDDNSDNQFPGWPVTIRQAENRGENVIA